jgi:phosphomannomutase
MEKIKFGTDGWRAIIAKEFTVTNVARVAEATAEWLSKKNTKSSVVLGHDCRFAGALFTDSVAKVLCSQGIKVFMTKGFVSTPMISLGAVKYKCVLGIIITASHNPPEYNGFKLKGSYGGPLLPDNVAEIENLIKDTPLIAIENLSLDEFEKSGLLEYVDLETMYCEQVEAAFDLEAIKNSELRFAYDAMYGAGQNVMRRLLPDITFLHAEYNPSFMGQAPEPIHKNLKEFSEMIRISENIDCGLVTDGDADRLGLYDNNGDFIDSHHIILLLIHYMYKYKGMRGKVCTAFSTTPRVQRLCSHYGIELETVKIGFKYIAEIMIKEDVLLGGEESGGIAIKGHIPERDGIWMGLVLWEFMAKSGKTLHELIDEVYEIVGPFSFERSDLHIREDVKQKVLANCQSGKYSSFGKYKVSRMEDLDGFKYFFENGDWLMIRASGTEPVLRTYAESSTKEAAFDILEEGKKTLLN